MQKALVRTRMTNREAYMLIIQAECLAWWGSTLAFRAVFYNNEKSSQETKYLKGISAKQLSPSHASCSTPKNSSCWKCPKRYAAEFINKALSGWEAVAEKHCINPFLNTSREVLGTPRYLIMGLQSSIWVAQNTVSCIWVVNILIKKLIGNSCVFVLQKSNVFMKSFFVEVVEHWLRLGQFIAIENKDQSVVTQEFKKKKSIFFPLTSYLHRAVTVITSSPEAEK